jgi:hypothetical protein
MEVPFQIKGDIFEHHFSNDLIDSYRLTLNGFVYSVQKNLTSKLDGTHPDFHADVVA